MVESTATRIAIVLSEIQIGRASVMIGVTMRSGRGAIPIMTV